MTGKTKSNAPGGGHMEWILELLIPGLFILILLGCLAHMGYCALQAQKQPVDGFQYAISAFAI